MGRKPGTSDMKNRIIDAAWKLFYEKGYAATTVDEIIELSNSSKGSFYYYFSAKDELLNTLNIVLDHYYDVLEEKIDPDMNCFDQLIWLNYEMHKWMGATIGKELLTSLYATQLSGDNISTLLDDERTYYRLLREIIGTGQEKGEIVSDISVKEIMKYYSMCERALVTDWCLRRDDDVSLESYSVHYFKIMMEHFKKKS